MREVQPLFLVFALKQWNERRKPPLRDQTGKKIAAHEDVEKGAYQVGDDDRQLEIVADHAWQKHLNRGDLGHGQQNDDAGAGPRDHPIEPYPMLSV